MGPGAALGAALGCGRAQRPRLPWTCCSSLFTNRCFVSHHNLHFKMSSPKGKSKKKAGAKAGKAGGSALTKKAGPTFPVGRTRSLLKGYGVKRVARTAPVYFAAIVEYLAAELVELSANACKDNKANRINPRFVQLAVRNDDDLGRLLGDVHLAGGGVVPAVTGANFKKKK